MVEQKNETFLLDGGYFDQGEVEFTVCKDCPTIRFNPTDPLMIARMYQATQDMASKQEEYKRRVTAVSTDSPELLDILNEVNDSMIDTLSGMFLHGISPETFGGVGVYAYNRNGIPIWVAFISAVMDRMDVSVKTAQSEQAAKVEKLLSKYKRK